MKLLMESWRKFLTEMSFADISQGKKGKWIKIPVIDLSYDPDEVPNAAGEIWDLINKSYEKEGGHINFPNPESMPGKESDWLVIDVDDDPEPDAVRAAKTKPPGLKMTVGASDGSPAGKEAYLQKTADLLKAPGNYGELSGAIGHIMIKYHQVPFVDNEQDVRKVLGKDIEWVGKHPDGKYPGYDGWYNRKIKGKDKMKILLGMPNGASFHVPGR